MAKTKKTTVSLTGDALWLAERAAERDNLSLSAWLSKAACHYALWQAPAAVVSEHDQMRDEEERAAEAEAYRAAR